MILLAVLAIIVGLMNVWIAMLRHSLEERVRELIIVVVLDAVILGVYNYLYDDPTVGIFLCVKYLFLCIIDFDKTLKKGL